MIKKSIMLFASILLVSISAYAQQVTETPVTVTDTLTVFPAATGSVNDFESLFSSTQIKELEKIIADFKATTGNEIAVASIDSIGSYEKFDNYALDLSNSWGIGRAEQSNGLTLIFSKKLRQIRISTSSGTETIISDEECKKIIDEVIVPQFKRGDFYKGIKLGLLEIIRIWK